MLRDCSVVHIWLSLPLERPDLVHLHRWYEAVRAFPSSKVLELPLSYADKCFFNFQKSSGWWRRPAICLRCC